MSSWVPMRTAPPEPLCLPSTSYAVHRASECGFRLKDRHYGGQSHRGRALQRIRCGATQALHSYHNTYKLLHPSGRAVETSPESQTPVQQEKRQKARPRAQPESVSADPPPLHEVTASQSVQVAANGYTGTPVASAAPSTIPSAAGAAPGIPGGDSAHTRPEPDSRDRSTPTPTTSTRAIMDSPLTAGTDSSSSNNNSGGGSSSNLYNGANPIGTAATAGGPPRRDAGDQPPFIPHNMYLRNWQPPATSLQSRTALTRAITTCPSYTRLHQLILDNASEFNAYHICAALSRVLKLHAAGLTPRESRLFKEGCSTLQAIMRRQLPELQPRALVVAAYSLARLELPDRELLAGLASATEPHLSALKPQGLCSLLWAFARQNHQPSPKWMDGALSACAADLDAFAPRDIATVLWALSRLRYKVAPERLRQLLDLSQARMGSFCGRSLSNLVYSLALSQQHPGAEWLAAAQARAVALGPDGFSPQGITQLAWGLAKLGATPSPALVNLLLEHASESLPRTPQDRNLEGGSAGQQPSRATAGGAGGSSSETGGASGSSGGVAAGKRPRARGRYTGVDLSTLMYVLACFGARPPAELGRRLLSAVQWALPSLEPNGMCNCLWACARLRLYPYKMWLSVFFDASYRQLPYFKPVDLSQTLWALARLGAAPPRAWMASVITRLHRSASEFSPVEVATTLWALARLGVRAEQLPTEVMVLFFIATDRRLSSFKPQELSSMVWGLARMRWRPDKEWTAELLKVTYHKLGTMSGRCLATIAWSLSELSLVPPPAWLYSFVNATRALMNASAASQQPSPPRPEAGGPQGLSALDLGQIITALRRLDGSGGGSGGAAGGGLAKVQEFLGEAEARLAEMEAASAAFARQQVGAFLALSPHQAGLPKAAADVLVPDPVAPDPRAIGISSDLDGSEDTGAVGGRAGVATPQGAPRRRATSGPPPQQHQHQLRQSVKRRRKDVGWERAATSPPGPVIAPGVSDTAPAGHGAVTAAAAERAARGVRGGARANLAGPPEVRVDLGGELSVELPASASGPVLWRPGSNSEAVAGVGPGSSSEAKGVEADSSSGSSSSNGHGAEVTGGAAGGEDLSVSLAEIKRRLLAV